MKKIFVTGGSGFLGKFLINHFKDKFKLIYPSSKECNLLNSKDLEKYSSIKFDFIFHLAAWTQAGDFCLKHPSDQWVINQIMNTNILSWWQKKQKNAKIIIIGTSCSYSPSLEHSEINYLKGEPIDSLYTYAMTKRMLLNGVMAAQKQYNLKWLCLVPSTLYGPNYHKDGRQMHFIFDLVRKLLDGKFNNKEVILWGDGNQKREVIHVKDFLIVFEKLLSEENEIFNIGSGEEKTIKEFAKIISNQINFDEGKIVYDTGKYVGAKSKVLNINKLKNFYPTFEKESIKIEDGLKELISWFKKNHD